MTPTCTWSREFRAECFQRFRLAQKLLALSVKDRDAAIRKLKAFELEHGKPQADLLRAEIKRQKK